VVTGEALRGLVEQLKAHIPILVAEDSEDEIFLLRRALAKARLEAHVQFVGDGEQVMEYLRGDGDYADRGRYPFPVLVVLDIKMPKMNGLETLSAIRNDPRFRRLVVVFLTSSSQERDVNHAFDLQVNSYLVKPSKPEALTDIVEHLKAYWLGLNHFPTQPV